MFYPWLAIYLAAFAPTRILVLGSDPLNGTLQGSLSQLQATMIRCAQQANSIINADCILQIHILENLTWTPVVTFELQSRVPNGVVSDV